jgi:hypothetical protein
MSDNRVDHCKALFEAARERLRNVLFREPAIEPERCEARAQLQSLSPDDMLERWQEKMEDMTNAAEYGIFSTDPRWHDNEEQTLAGIRQFEEGVDDVVFLIYEATDRERKGGPLKGGVSESSRFTPWQVSVSEWHERVREVLDEVDSEVLSWCTGPPPPPLDRGTPDSQYEGSRDMIDRMAFQPHDWPESLQWCETKRRLETMSQEALDMLFDHHMKNLYFDAYHNILGRYTKEDSEAWFLELCDFEKEAFIVIWLIYEALDREEAGTAERVSKWRDEVDNFLYRTQSCGRPCFHAGIVPEDPTFDGSYPFPCDEEHQTSDDSHDSES